jgi:hypothetical protein
MHLCDNKNSMYIIHRRGIVDRFDSAFSKKPQVRLNLEASYSLGESSVVDGTNSLKNETHSL